jgi:hypothetical protein
VHALEVVGRRRGDLLARADEPVIATICGSGD